MSEIKKQSIRNVIFTYFGFAIGAINVLFLYTNILSPSQFGEITLIVSYALLLWPIISFGVGNSIIKFYEEYRLKSKENELLSMLLTIPFFLFVVVVSLYYLFVKNSVIEYLKESYNILNYDKYIFIISFCIIYFEIFYSYSKVLLKTIFGNFLKEVFVRVVVFIMLFLYYFDKINFDIFVKLLSIAYFVRTILMIWYVFRKKPFRFASFSVKNNIYVLKFSFFVTLSLSATIFLLEIDKIMLGEFINLKNVAYYTVAVYISSVLVVPFRATNQIITPITVKLITENNWNAVAKLYKDSSINLLVVSGLIFLIINANIVDILKFIPNEYSKAAIVVLVLSVTKLFDSATSINGIIISNSEYYKYDIIFVLILFFLTILMNFIFIPKFGINGAAMATAITIFVYNLLKTIFVNIKFGMHPFSNKTIVFASFLLVLSVFFIGINFHFHPIINIIIKTFLIITMYLYGIYKMNLSEFISEKYKKNEK